MQERLNYLIQQGIVKYGITSPQQQNALGHMVSTYANYLTDVSAPSFIDVHSKELELKKDSASADLINYPGDYSLEQAFEAIVDEYLMAYRAKVLFENNINQGPSFDGILPEEEEIFPPTNEIVVELKKEEQVDEVVVEPIEEVKEEEPTITNTQLLDMIQRLTEEIISLKTEVNKEQEPVVTPVIEELTVDTVEEPIVAITEEEKETEEVKVLDENLEPVN